MTYKVTAVREARIAAGITQNIVAQKARINKREYQYYESGTRTPNAYTAVRLAKALCTTVEALYDDTRDSA